MMESASGGLSRDKRRVAILFGSVILLSVAAMIITKGGRHERIALYQYAYFYQQFLFEDHLHAIAGVVALLSATLVRSLRDWVTWLSGRIGAYAWRSSAIAFMVLLACAKFVYQAHPYSMDEYAPVLQAHAFAWGEMAVKYPQSIFNLIIPPVFHGWFFQVDPVRGEAVSAYWPGMALLFAPFTWLHLEAALNPALSGLALWLIGDLAVRMSGNDRARGWAMLVALASPQFTVNAFSFYAMPALLAFNLFYFWLLTHPGWRWSAAAGVVGSFALILHNPVPHALFALPCMVWLALDRARRPDLVALLLGYLPLGLLLGLGWPMLVASSGLGGGSEVAGSTGFVTQWTQKLGQVFSLPGKNVLLVRWYSLWKTWIWAAPGVIVLAVLAYTRTRGASVLWAAFLLTMGFYFFVPYDQGFGWGYRYIHAVWMVVPILAGVWIASSEKGKRTLGAAMVVAGLLASPVYMLTTQQRISSALEQRIEPPQPGYWVVFVAMNPGHPTAELVQNYPDRPEVMYLFSQGEQADASLMHYLAPDAVRVTYDERGSLWRLPGGMGGSRGGVK